MKLWLLNEVVSLTIALSFHTALIIVLGYSGRSCEGVGFGGFVWFFVIVVWQDCVSLIFMLLFLLINLIANIIKNKKQQTYLDVIVSLNVLYQ